MSSACDTVGLGILFATLFVILFASFGALTRQGGGSLVGASRMSLYAGSMWVVMRLAGHWLFHDPWSRDITASVITAGFWAVMGALVWGIISLRAGGAV